MKFEIPALLAGLIDAMRAARAALNTFEMFDPANIDPEEWRKAKRKSLEARALIAVSTGEVARIWRQPSLHVPTPQPPQNTDPRSASPGQHTRNGGPTP